MRFEDIALIHADDHGFRYKCINKVNIDHLFLIFSTRNKIIPKRMIHQIHITDYANKVFFLANNGL